MTAQLGDNALMNSFKALNDLRNKESIQFGRTMFCSVGDLFIFARNAPGFPSFVVVLNMGEATAHRFSGDACFSGRTTAELVYHSAEHEDHTLNLAQAIFIKKNEAMVLQFPA
jgi:hypothetical protein